MFISALCIVKNEQKNLPRWLANMQNVADELFVVDTGSSDDSVSVARAGGASVVHFAWSDDFAAARNFALSLAKGDMIIFLDADEYYPDKSLCKLRLLIGQMAAQRKLGGILAPRIDIESGDEESYIGASWQCRIFRRGCSYRGTIHESLVVPEGLQLLQDERLYFYHTGYAAGVIQEKLKRNLAMLQRRAASPGYVLTPLDWRYLLDCYYGLGDFPHALAASGKCLQYADDLADELSYIYKIRVKAALFGGSSVAFVLSVLDEAVERGNKAYFLQLRGQYLWSMGRHDAAKAALFEGLRMAEAAPPYDMVQELLPMTRKLLALSV